MKTKYNIAPGDVFERLTVVSLCCNKSSLLCKCVCTCGSTKTIRAADILRGFTRSCGCLAKETSKVTPYKDGRSMHPLYNIWKGMIRRCTNKHAGAYRFYGERGIKVCERWSKSIYHFGDDMGPRPSPAHSLDRVDNYGDYTPDNCRWSTSWEQKRNTRRVKITQEIANAVRRMKASGNTSGDIARLFNITISHVRHVVNNESWIER